MPTSSNIAIICLSILLISPAFMANAQAAGSATQLAEKASNTQQQIQFLDDEIALLSERRQDAEQQLQAYKADIAAKQAELDLAQNRYVSAPTPENEQFLRNAEKRIELAKLTIESRSGAIERLEAKEQDLRNKQNTLTKQVTSLSEQARQRRLADKVATKTQAIKSELNIEITALQQQMESLQRENERLRRVILIETEKREMSELRVGQAEDRARLAEESIARLKLRSSNEIALNDAIEDGGDLNAKEKAMAEMERLNNIIATTNATSPSQTLRLEGDDGSDYGVFQYLGAQQYRADAIIYDTSARFKVGGRMYQVKVAESAIGEEYVFLYDLRDTSQPRFVAFRKGLLGVGGEVIASE